MTKHPKSPLAKILLMRKLRDATEPPSLPKKRPATPRLPSMTTPAPRTK